MNIFQTMANI